MKIFWPMVFVANFVALIGVQLLPGVHRGAGEHTWGARLAFHALTSLMVISVWAICFRPAIEQRRVSLWAIFVLIAMESLLFCAIKVLRSY